MSLFIDFIESNSAAGIDAEALRTLASDFQQQQALMLPIYRRSYDDCHRARIQRDFDDKRNDHLGRLIVRLISDHFVENGALPPEEGGLSRRIVPPLLTLLDLTLGVDVLNEYRSRGAEIVARVREHTGDEFEWEDYFEDTEAQILLAEVLIKIALSFDDYGKRIAWILDVINKALQRNFSAEEDIEHWTFEEIHFQTLARAMFRPIMAATSDAEKRIAFAAAFGQEQMSSVTEFLKGAGLS